MDREMLYNLIYALAATGGREATLFGNSAGNGHEAFQNGLCGEAFPELWFELPLLGDPWFDLHMLVSRRDMHGGMRFKGLGPVYSDALEWFATSKNTRQLALSFDSGSGDTTHPAVQLLMDTRDSDVTCDFLATTAGPEAARYYHDFIVSIPREWYPCYTGLFPARTQSPGSSWIRVECIVTDGLQSLYASDLDLLHSHLTNAGIHSADREFLSYVQELARSPFPLELQFNVGPEGRARQALSASIRFTTRDWLDPLKSREVAKMFEQAQTWGLADDRWHELENTKFAKLVSTGNARAHVFCFPVFLKLRWIEDHGMDAKAYLLANTN